MRHRDEKPIAATALVVAVVLGIGTLVRVINTYEAAIEDRHHRPFWVVAGK
jgi:hypothetical protein